MERIGASNNKEASGGEVHCLPKRVLGGLGDGFDPCAVTSFYFSLS